MVGQAAARGLSAIAITDHDVLTGLAEARAAADAAGLELLDGIELTTDWDGRACHLLGYGIDPANVGLRRALDDGRARMESHVRAVLAEIQAAGHQLDEADLQRYNTRYATGTALVLGMLERGILRRSTEARRLLRLAGSEPRAYTIEEGIRLILAAGGLPALAHPARLTRGEPLQPAERFRPLVAAGLGGLEVWHVLQPEPIRDHYQQVADRLGLVAVGGSDCHGPRSTGVRIGGQQVPARVLSALRERLPAPGSRAPG